MSETTNPGAAAVSIGHDTPVRLGLVLVAAGAVAGAAVLKFQVEDVREQAKEMKAEIRDLRDGSTPIALRLQRVEDALARIEAKLNKREQR